MSAVHDSVEIVNAAANAIAAAESRVVQVQPSTTVHKRKWPGNWLNPYLSSCFGSYKDSRRVGHALILSEHAAVHTVAASNPIIIESSNGGRSSTTALIFPFIAPPSSPASFLQSDPPSSTQTPNGPLSMASPVKTSQIYTIGPYAHETQLVSPPVFSTFTTEPSTACFTPPPETVAHQQMTSPTSPEVPFAQLLMSSLARSRRSGNGPDGHQKYSLAQCEFKPYYQCPSSPGSYIKSPSSSVVSTSGTCSPFPDKVQRFMGVSCNNNNNHSCNVLESQLPEDQLGNDEVAVDHRVSFELIGEDIPTCIVREAIPSGGLLSCNDLDEAKLYSKNGLEDNCSGRYSNEDALSEVLGMTLDVGEEEFSRKDRTVSLGSSKDFDFSHANGGASSKDKPTVDCEWWTNEKVVDSEDW